MRALVACEACRSRRRKCAPQDNDSLVCQYCFIRSIRCVRKSFNHGAHSPSKESTSELPRNSCDSSSVANLELQLPPPEVCMELVELYFNLIHDQFHSLFHRPSFMEALRSGSAPRVILLAMMAFSARFSTHTMFAHIPPRERSRLYYDESAKLLDIRETSVTTIQACVLLGGISTTEDNAMTESIYYTVACRMANLLNLPHRQTSIPLENEINNRVWWTLCMVDVWSSKSVRLPRQMIHLPDLDLPINEAAFLQMRPGLEITSFFDPDRSSSLLAQMIKLNRILMEVNDVIAEAASSNTTTALIIEHRIIDLSQKLSEWHHSLPDDMLDTSSNLERYAAQGLGRLFVAVYLGYYHFGQILLYQFLHEDRDRASEQYVYLERANKCKEFAASLCNLVYRAHATPNCEVWYNMVGHILVIASTIQIHTLLFSTDETEISSARSRLEQNFTILLRLKEYWPMLESCFARLQIFHEVCRKNAYGDSSFQMDQWMLRFLSEFAEPMREKDEMDENGGGEVRGLWNVNHVGFSPQNWV